MASSIWYDGVSESPLSGLSRSGEDTIVFQQRTNTAEPPVWATAWVTAGLQVILCTPSCRRMAASLGLTAEESHRLPDPFDSSAKAGRSVRVPTDNIKNVFDTLAAMTRGKPTNALNPAHIRSSYASLHSSIACSKPAHDSGDVRSSSTESESKRAAASRASRVAERIASHLPTFTFLLASDACTSAYCILLAPAVGVDKKGRYRLRYRASAQPVLPSAELICLSPAGNVCLVLSPTEFSASRSSGEDALTGSALLVASSSSARPIVAPVQWQNPQGLALRHRRADTLHWVWGTSRPFQCAVAVPGCSGDSDTSDTMCDLILMERNGHVCHITVAWPRTPEDWNSARNTTLRLRALTKVRQPKTPATRAMDRLPRVSGAVLPSKQVDASLAFEYRWCHSPWLAEALAQHVVGLRQQAEAFDVAVLSRRAPRGLGVVALSHDRRVALCHDVGHPTALFLTCLDGEDCSATAHASRLESRQRHSIAAPLPYGPDVAFEDAAFVTSHGMQGFLCVYRSHTTARAMVQWYFVPLAGVPCALSVQPLQPLDSVADARKIVLADGRLFVSSVETAEPDAFGDAAVLVRLGNTSSASLLSASLVLPSPSQWLTHAYVAPLCRGEYTLGASAAVAHLHAWVRCSLLGTLTTPVVPELLHPSQGVELSNDDGHHSTPSDPHRRINTAVEKAAQATRSLCSPYAPLGAPAQFLHDVLAPLTAQFNMTGSADSCGDSSSGQSAGLACLAAVFQAVGACTRAMQASHGSTPIPFTACAGLLAECVDILGDAVQVLIGHGSTSTLMACLGALMWSASVAALHLPLQPASAVAEATVAASWRCLWSPLFDLAYPVAIHSTSPLADREVLLPYCSAAVQQVEKLSRRWTDEERARRSATSVDGTTVPLLGWASKEPSAAQVLAAMRCGEAVDVRTLSLTQAVSTARRLAMEAGPAAASEYLSYFTRHDGCHPTLVQEWQQWSSLEAQTRSAVYGL